jgi:branched-chain amino acid transport system permease protein
MSVLIVGLLLGGTYALIAIGLQLQYGVARVMNLAYGEVIVAGAFGTFWFFAASQMSPLWSIIGVVPLAFAVNWAVYRILILPLVRRAKSQGQLDVDSILATFGLSFVFISILLTIFGGEMLTYSYLARPFVIFGEPYALNRIAAFFGSAILAICLYVWLHWTRAGLSLRAVAVNPAAAALVSINVERASAMAFALGGAVSAAGGSLLSMFLTFDASQGVIFTLKALVIVILGGVSDIRGAIIAAFILGLTETFVASFIDPGLTLAAAYALFIIILLVRPEGLFGRRSA